MKPATAGSTDDSAASEIFGVGDRYQDPLARNAAKLVTYCLKERERQVFKHFTADDSSCCSIRQRDIGEIAPEPRRRDVTDGGGTSIRSDHN